MARLLTSTLAGWLFALSCVGLLQVARCQADQSECVDELFVKLDNHDLDVNGARELLDKVEDKDATKIGRVSVAKILKFNSTSCDLEDLVDLHLLSREVLYSCPAGVDSRDGWRTNYGVHLFLNTHRAKRIKTCQQEILPKFLAAVQHVNSFVGQEASKLFLKSKWTWLSLGDGKFKISDEDLTNRDPLKKHKQLGRYFANCYFFTDGLGKYMPYSKFIRAHLNPSWIRRLDPDNYRVYVSSNTMEVCKAYMDKFCVPIEYEMKRQRSLCDGQQTLQRIKDFCLDRATCQSFRQRHSKWTKTIKDLDYSSGLITDDPAGEL